MLGVQLAQCVGRVTGRGAIELYARESEGRIVLERGGDQPSPKIRVQPWATGLVRRLEGRNQPDLIEAELPSRLCSRDEMADVNGIEAPTQQADPSLSGRARLRSPGTWWS